MLNARILQRPKLTHNSGRDVRLLSAQVHRRATAVRYKADKRDQEIAAHKAYLKECWYSLALGSNISKDKVSTVEFCGEQLSLYRDPQGVVQCSKYRVKEMGNVVFVYRGDAKELPHIWHPPQFQQPGWRHFYGEVSINANHWMVFENVIDMAHVLVVHKDAAPGLDKLPDVLHSVDEENNVIRFSFPLQFPLLGELGGFATAVLPSNSFIEFRMPFGFKTVVFGCVMPVNMNKSVIRYCVMRNILPFAWADPLWQKTVQGILQQDKDILEVLKPEATNFEVSSLFDAPQLSFRRMRKKHMDALAKQESAAS